jgi:transforming growth factor-beta-induced protein
VLCDAVTAAGLGDALSTNTFTVFAPTDQAFEELLEVLGLSSLDDIPLDTLTDVLLYHAVPDKVLESTDVAKRCSKLLTMANGMETRTVCRDDHIFQNGAGNDKNDRPKIILTDIEACNGIIHVVDEVILPSYLNVEDSTTDPPSKCESIGT